MDTDIQLVKQSDALTIFLAFFKSRLKIYYLTVKIIQNDGGSEFIG